MIYFLATLFALECALFALGPLLAWRWLGRLLNLMLGHK